MAQLIKGGLVGPTKAQNTQRVFDSLQGSMTNLQNLGNELQNRREVSADAFRLSVIEPLIQQWGSPRMAAANQPESFLEWGKLQGLNKRRMDEFMNSIAEGRMTPQDILKEGQTSAAEGTSTYGIPVQATGSDPQKALEQYEQATGDVHRPVMIGDKETIMNPVASEVFAPELAAMQEAAPNPYAEMAPKSLPMDDSGRELPAYFAGLLAAIPALAGTAGGAAAGGMGALGSLGGILAENPILAKALASQMGGSQTGIIQPPPPVETEMYGGQMMSPGSRNVPVMAGGGKSDMGVQSKMPVYADGVPSNLQNIITAAQHVGYQNPPANEYLKPNGFYGQNDPSTRGPYPGIQGSLASEQLYQMAQAQREKEMMDMYSQTQGLARQMPLPAVPNPANVMGPQNFPQTVPQYKYGMSNSVPVQAGGRMPVYAGGSEIQPGSAGGRMAGVIALSQLPVEQRVQLKMQYPGMSDEELMYMAIQQERSMAQQLAQNPGPTGQFPKIPMGPQRPSMSSMMRIPSNLQQDRVGAIKGKIPVMADGNSPYVVGPDGNLIFGMDGQPILKQGTPAVPVGPMVNPSGGLNTLPVQQDPRASMGQAERTAQDSAVVGSYLDEQGMGLNRLATTPGEGPVTGGRSNANQAFDDVTPGDSIMTEEDFNRLKPGDYIRSFTKDGKKYVVYGSSRTPSEEELSVIVTDEDGDIPVYTDQTDEIPDPVNRRVKGRNSVAAGDASRWITRSRPDALGRDFSEQTQNFLNTFYPEGADMLDLIHSPADASESRRRDKALTESIRQFDEDMALKERRQDFDETISRSLAGPEFTEQQKLQYEAANTLTNHLRDVQTDLAASMKKPISDPAVQEEFGKYLVENDLVNQLNQASSIMANLTGNEIFTAWGEVAAKDPKWYNTILWSLGRVFDREKTREAQQSAWDARQIGKGNTTAEARTMFTSDLLGLGSPEVEEVTSAVERNRRN